MKAKTILTLGLTLTLAGEQLLGHAKPHLEAQEPTQSVLVISPVTATNTTSGLPAMLYNAILSGDEEAAVAPRVVY